MIFFSIYNSLWLSDSVRNLGKILFDYNYGSFGLSCEIRDYRTPSPIYGDTYKLNLFKLSAKYFGGDWEMHLGDNNITAGRGLSVFLSYDDRALLESFLRGAYFRWRFLNLYGGLKRKWIYFQGDSDTTYIGGVNFDFKTLGINGIRYFINSKGGYLISGNLNASLGLLKAYLEGAYRFGYDPTVFAEDTGYGIFGNLTFSYGDLSLSLEGKNYKRLYVGFNIPAPANGYGLLPTNARYERGGSVYLYYKTLYAEFSRGLSTLNGEKVMDFIKLQYYTNVLNDFITLKVSAHRLYWFQNLDEYLAFWEIKTKTEPSFIGYLEYRKRKGDEPFASFSILYKGITLGISGRYYKFQKKRDYLLGIAYDNYRFLRLSLSYGSFSGDIVCSSGVCRYEPPFKGFKGEIQVSITHP
ncbi:MAG: DUF6029 family protein [candidate division WOR-3 bacterium]